jgi:hypothetical protein
MQAASMVMSMLSSTIQVNPRSGKNNPQVPTFGQAFNDKMSEVQLQAPKDKKAATCPYAVNDARDNAPQVPVLKGALKRSGGSQAKGSNRQSALLSNNNPAAQVMAVIPVAMLNMTREVSRVGDDQNSTETTKRIPYYNAAPQAVGNSSAIPAPQAAADSPESQTYPPAGATSAPRVAVQANPTDSAASFPAEAPSRSTNPADVPAQAVPGAMQSSQISNIIQSKSQQPVDSTDQLSVQTPQSSIAAQNSNVVMAVAPPINKPVPSASPVKASDNGVQINVKEAPQEIPSSDSAATLATDHAQDADWAPMKRATSSSTTAPQSLIGTVVQKQLAQPHSAAVGSRNAPLDPKAHAMASQPVLRKEPEVHAVVARISDASRHVDANADKMEATPAKTKPEVPNQVPAFAAEDAAEEVTNPKPAPEDGTEKGTTASGSAAGPSPKTAETANSNSIASPPSSAVAFTLASVASVPADVAAHTMLNPSVAASANEHCVGESAKDGTTADSCPNESMETSAQATSVSDIPEKPGIVSAQISGNSAQSEIHLAMQGDKLGPIELHARVTGEQVGANIVVEKKDAREALATELPALRQALTEKNLSIEHVWLTQGSLHATAQEGGSAPDQHPNRQMQQGANSQPQSGQAWRIPVAALVAENAEIFDDQGRLSVRA